MSDINIPFQTIDWTTIPKTGYKGEKGFAIRLNIYYNTESPRD